jgi:hypothetical protein
MAVNFGKTGLAFRRNGFPSFQRVKVNEVSSLIQIFGVSTLNDAGEVPPKRQLSHCVT